MLDWTFGQESSSSSISIAPSFHSWILKVWKRGWIPHRNRLVSPLSRLWSVLFKIYAKDTSKSLRVRTPDEYQAGKTLLTMLEKRKINARNKNSYLEHQIFIITPFCGAKNESSLHMWPVPITGSVSKSWKYLSDKQSRHWLSGWLRWFHNTCLKSTWNELMACCCCRWW